jgi:septal ring factor EnvC (AmiA/AmiB activator)
LFPVLTEGQDWKAKPHPNIRELSQVRIRIFIAAALGVVLAASNTFVGCATAPMQCGVSPVDIEEVKSDTRDLEKELAEVQGRLKVAQDDLARWQARLADRKQERPRLQAELERLKKHSGVTEKIDIDVKPRQQTEDVDPLEIDIRN